MTEADFEELRAKNTENRNLDFKERMNWTDTSKDEKGSLVKDLLAMTNTQDGGYILLGVRNSDYALVGLSEEEFASFDVTKVNDFLHRYADPKFSCEVYKLLVSGKRAVAIFVPEFHDSPNICKNTLHSSDNTRIILQAGAIYSRTDDGKSTVVGAHEMRELLGRAVVKRGDALLEDIRRLIQGKPAVPEKSLEEHYAAEIKGADDFLIQPVASKFAHLGGWELYAFPTNYQKERLTDPKDVKRLIDAAQVRLRGWYFPHIDRTEAKYFVSGCQSMTSTRQHHEEGYQAYQSGLFVWKALLPEDLREDKDEKGRRVLPFVRVIWEVTEMLIFLKRYYEGQPLVESVRVKLALHGTANRALTSPDFGVWLDDTLVAGAPNIVLQRDIPIVQLKASAEDVASWFILKIFLVFGWDDASAEMVASWQKKLVERKF